VIDVAGVDPGSRVVVGCSGGPDSLALLVLAREADLDVVAVYVDHGLRATSRFDADVVAAAADRFGARFRSVTVEVDARANVEARARDARYAALERVRQEEDAVAILVGHTRDDQAETVLLNLLRGSGTAGLAGMAPRRGMIVRPLLGMRRAATRELCARHSLVPVYDAMNEELRHRRVWLRREVIPRLEQGASRDIVEVLARQADLLRDDDVLLDDLAQQHVTDDARAIAELPPALARRVIRQWLGSPPPAAATVERVLAIARGERSAAQLAGGGRVERVGGRIVFSVHNENEPLLPVDLPVPGRVRFDGLEVEAWIEHSAPTAWPDGRSRVVCDADVVGERAVIRAAKAGERFRPLGRSGSKLVRDALAEAGVPASRRDRAPVVANGDLIWVVGYRIDDRTRVTSGTRRFLWLSAETEDL
jgi:tRNA(Ile)-lysidine synthase